MVGFAGRQLVELYRRGFALFVLAPVIVAIAVLPEFLQHAVEIRIGMFDDIAAARALGDDPRRMAFGYAKIAGLVIAMFAAARYWGTRERGGRWWRLGDVAWVPFVLGAAAVLLGPLVTEPLRGRLPEAVHSGLNLALSIALLPLFLPTLAAWFGDRRANLLRDYWRSWRWLPLLVLLLAAAYAPAFGAHIGLHRLALGQATPLVWALMTLDALVVGLIASLTGAAFALSYAAAYPEANP